MTTTGNIRYVASSVPSDAVPWQRLDRMELSVEFEERQLEITNLRGKEADFSLEKNGFSVHRAPTSFTKFDDMETHAEEYYKDVVAFLEKQIPDACKMVVYGHVCRLNRDGGSEESQSLSKARLPANQMHVDQSPIFARDLVNAVLPAEEAKERLKRRFMAVNIWRPINNAASDQPLAIVDWRTTKPEDYVKVRLLLPNEELENVKAKTGLNPFKPFDGEVLFQHMPKPDGFSQAGVGLVIKPNPEHKLYYARDLSPDEVILIKCYDSFGEDQPMGKPGVATYAPHTSFADPQTAPDAPKRRSIELRCLVFF